MLAAGSTGEVCAFLIIAASLYLIVTRTANWRLTVGMLGGACFINALLWLGGADRFLPFPQLLFAGSLLYGAAFMVTDPISAPRTSKAKWMYAVAVGMFYVLIRWKGQFAGALSFSLLLGNMIGPTLDMSVRGWQSWRKAVISAKAKAGGGAS